MLGLASLMVAAGCGGSSTGGTGGSENVGGNGTAGAPGGNAAGAGRASGRGGAASSGGASSGGAIGLGGASSGGAIGLGGASAGGTGVPAAGGVGGAPAGTGDTGSGGRGGATGGTDERPSAGGHAGSAAGASGSAGSSASNGDCTFSMSYDIFTSPVDGEYIHATLSPPASFALERLNWPSGTFPIVKCAPALPACQTPTAIDAADIVAAMAHPDVKRAFDKLVTHYAPAGDAPMLTVGRYSDDHEFIETDVCSAPDCTPAPEGVRVLLTLLRTLLTQQLADPTCQDPSEP